MEKEQQKLYVFYYRVEHLDGPAEGHISDHVKQDAYLATGDDDAVEQVRKFIALVEKPGFLKIRPIENDPLRYERPVPFVR